MMEVAPDSPRFKFDATATLKDNAGKDFVKQMTVCVENSSPLLFQANRAITDALRAQICADSAQCATQSDLRADLEGSAQALELHMEGKVIRNASLKDGGFALTADKNIYVRFAYEELFDVDADGNLALHFDAYSFDQSDQGCQFVFQQKHFEANYLHILRNFGKDDDFFYVSFRKINPGEFAKVSGFLKFLLVLLIVLSVLLVVYIVYGCVVRCRREKGLAKAPAQDAGEGSYEEING